MNVSIDNLRRALNGKRLPGGRIVIEAHEAFIADEALRAVPDRDRMAHPFWFIAASLRCMGISVQHLCALMEQQEGDTLLFGSCRVEQQRPLRVGGEYTATARIGEVTSRTTRDGSRLDSVEVVVRLRTADTAHLAGVVTSTYLLKRGAAA